MFPSKIELQAIASVLFVVCGLLIWALVDATRGFEKVTGSDYKSMSSLKRDCEKSLPRDKVCVMVFDYVPVENDYE